MAPGGPGAVRRRQCYAEFLTAAGGAGEGAESVGRHAAASSFLSAGEAQPRPALAHTFTDAFLAEACMAAPAGAYFALPIDAGLDNLESGAVQLACLPLIGPPAWFRSEPISVASGDQDGTTNGVQRSERMQYLEHALSIACTAQASIGVFQLLATDVMSGVIGLSVAAMGSRAASSPLGHKDLPSYVVVAFANGAMQLFDCFRAHSCCAGVVLERGGATLAEGGRRRGRRVARAHVHGRRPGLASS